MNYLKNAPPEILGLDIRCKSVARQGRHAHEDPERPVFFARYMGESLEEAEKANAAKASAAARSGAAAATASQVFSANTLNIPDPLSNAPELSVKISTWSISLVDQSSMKLNGSTTAASSSSSGWVLPFTIPIPTRHFAKMESRQFRLKAVVKVKVPSIVPKARPGEKVQPLSGSGAQDMDAQDSGTTEQNGDILVVSRPIEVTVSHLRRGREMSAFHQPIAQRAPEHPRLSNVAMSKDRTKKSNARKKVVLQYESGDECSDDEFTLA